MTLQNEQWPSLEEVHTLARLPQQEVVAALSDRSRLYLCRIQEVLCQEIDDYWWRGIHARNPDKGASWYPKRILRSPLWMERLCTLQRRVHAIEKSLNENEQQHDASGNGAAALSFPFDGGRRLVGEIEEHEIDPDLGEPTSHRRTDVIGQNGGLGSHRVRGDDRTQHNALPS